MHAERGAIPFLRGEFQPSPQHLRASQGNIQPETGPLGGADVARPVKSIEQSFLVSLRDTNSPVGDGEDEIVSRPRGLQSDGRIGRGIFQGIGQEVLENMVQQMRIGKELRGEVRLDSEINLPPGINRIQSVDDPFKVRLYFHRFRFYRNLPRLCPAEKENFIQKVIHPLERAVDVAVMPIDFLGRQLVPMRPKEIGGGMDAGHRCPEFMAHHGDEARLDFVEFLLPGKRVADFLFGFLPEGNIATDADNTDRLIGGPGLNHVFPRLNPDNFP